MSRPTRRRLLSGIGAAGAATLAGCSTSLPFDEGFDYRDWLFAPRNRSGDEEYDRSGVFDLYRPRAILQHEAHLPSSYSERFRGGNRWTEMSGIAVAELEYALQYNWLYLWRGGFDGADVERELSASGFEADRDHRGYTIFLVRDEEAENYGWAVAVSDDTILLRQYHTRDLETEAEALAFAIDARKGDHERFVDVVDAADTLTGELDAGHDRWGRIHPDIDPHEVDPEEGRFPGLVGTGRSLRIDGAETRLERVFVFESAAAAAEADVGTWVATREDAATDWQHADDIDTNVDGETVVATARIDSGTLSTG